MSDAFDHLPRLGARVRVRPTTRWPDMIGRQGMVDDWGDGGGEFGDDPPPSSVRVKFFDPVASMWLDATWFDVSELEVLP